MTECELANFIFPNFIFTRGGIQQIEYENYVTSSLRPQTKEYRPASRALIGQSNAFAATRTVMQVPDFVAFHSETN